MTTYYIGTGQTYTTITAFLAAITPSSGDIIDGTDSTFSELWSLSAASNVTYRKAIINATGINIGLYCSGKTNETVDNVTVNSSNVRNFYVTTGSGNTLQNCVSYNSIQKGFSLYNTSNAVLDTCTANVGAGGYFLEGTTTASVINSIAQNMYKDTTIEAHGFRLLNSAVISFDMCVAIGNSGDGFNNNNTSTMNCIRCSATTNGMTTNTSAGDGFTGHDDSISNIDLCFAKNNFKDACGFVGNTTGRISHLTAINNGRSDVARGEIYLTSTSVFTVKNNLIYNNQSYPIVRYDGSTAHIFDYNCYISNLSSPFSVAGAMKTFAEWIAIIGNETHSIFIHINNGAYDVYYGNAPTIKATTLTYCPIDANGQLIARSDNPLIDAGVVISGVNDSTQTDIWGYPIFGHAPNIGASQQYGRGTAKGTLTFKWKTGFNDADVSGNLNILSFDGTTNSISYDADNNLIKITDGTNTASKALTVVADTEYTIQASWGLVSGSPKMQIAVDGTAGAQATFAGTFNPSDIYFGLNNEELQYIKDMKVYKVATWL